RGPFLSPSRRTPPRCSRPTWRAPRWRWRIPRCRPSYIRPPRPHRRGAPPPSPPRTTLSAARRRAAPARRAWSQDFGLFTQQPHQLAHRPGALADDLPFFTIGWRCERDDLHRARSRLYRFYVERLFLRRHDAFECGVAGLVESLVGGEHRGQRKVHDFDAAFDLPLGDTFRPLDVEMPHGGDAR